MNDNNPENQNFQNGLGATESMSGQPMPNQPMSSQPMQGQPMPGQPMPNPNQPLPSQPMPMARPPKQPMDPEKKKRIIIVCSILGGAVVIGIALAVILPMILRVDYASAYNTAKELKPKIQDIYYSYDCERVVDYVDYSYTSTKTYNEYVNGCVDLFNAGTTDLVVKLKDTPGVSRNGEIKQQFDKFNSEYAALTSGSIDDLKSRLEIYQTWHNFAVAVDDLSYSSSSDAEFTAAANILTNSNNEALKTYGSGWLEHSLAVAVAYRAYDNASTNWSALYDTYRSKLSEFKDWAAANRPDITEMAPLNFDDTSKMYNEFSKLYSLIAETYAENYNQGSGDCTEFLGSVYCE